MDTSILNTHTSFQAGSFERYVQELCRQYVMEQLQEINIENIPRLIGKNERFLTKREAANLIGKGEKMIDNYRKMGLPTHMFGRTPMFRESELISFLETYTHKCQYREITST